MGALSDSWSERNRAFSGEPGDKGTGALSDSWGGGRKLGSNYYGGAFGKNYKAQSLMYRRALRQLTYQARRGDTDSALNAIRVRDEANRRGFTPVNQERGEFMRDMRGSYKTMEAEGQALERGNALDRGIVNEELGALGELRRRREEEERRRRAMEIQPAREDPYRRREADAAAVDPPVQIRKEGQSVAGNRTRKLGDRYGSTMAYV